MDFKDKSGKTLNCKMSCIPVKLCEFPTKELTLVAVYGFGAERDKQFLSEKNKITAVKPV